MTAPRDRWLEALTVPRIAIGVFGLWLLSPIILKVCAPSLSDAGLFGDSYGGVNALFSGLAFGGVIYAILLQQKELQLQREELAMTREELKRTAVAQEKAEAALKDQAQTMRVAAEMNALASVIQAESMQLGVLHSEGSVGNRPRANQIPPLEQSRDRHLADLKSKMTQLNS